MHVSKLVSTKSEREEGEGKRKLKHMCDTIYKIIWNRVDCQRSEKNKTIQKQQQQQQQNKQTQNTQEIKNTF